jgi:hypothetical protein
VVLAQAVEGDAADCILYAELVLEAEGDYPGVTDEEQVVRHRTGVAGARAGAVAGQEGQGRIAGAVAPGAGELPVVVTGLPLPVLKQGGERLPEPGGGLVGKHDPPTDLDQIHGVEFRNDAKVCFAGLAPLHLEGAEVGGFDRLAEGEVGGLLRRHRGEQISAAGAVDAIREERSRVHNAPSRLAPF